MQTIKRETLSILRLCNSCIVLKRVVFYVLSRLFSLESCFCTFAIDDDDDDSVHNFGYACNFFVAHSPCASGRASADCNEHMYWWRQQMQMRWWSIVKVRSLTANNRNNSETRKICIIFYHHFSFSWCSTCSAQLGSFSVYRLALTQTYIASYFCMQFA